jgi:hypothetical protein
MVGVMMAKWVADAFGRDGLYEEAILFNGYPYLDNKIECAVARNQTATANAPPGHRPPAVPSQLCCAVRSRRSSRRTDWCSAHCATFTDSGWAA